MIIIEQENWLQKIQKLLQSGPSFWIPMYSDPFQHFMNNHISFIYIYSISKDLDYIVPYRHKDCFNLNIELLNDLTSPNEIYVLAKKRFANFYSKKCYDADMVAWWQTHKMLPLDETNTSAHDAWNKWWHNETNTHDWLPITKHIERCVGMRKKFMEYYSTFELTKEFESYERMVTDNFYAIERTGLQIDYNKFTEKFKANGIVNNKAYTEYNIYTTTGRPSNKFGGVNYAALNKEDGCREAFVSRFEQGSLLEMDFDAYHPRLIADIIGYELPEGSIHEYFARQYFGKEEISEQEYEDSKKITFRLLYGGIDKDFEKVPFFGKVKQYINELWKTYKKQGYIETPYFKRPLYAKYLHEMNPNKLFNYLLQASETENNLHVIDEVNGVLHKYNTELILYTYDSLLFDFDMRDGKELIIKLQETMSKSNKYPVKIKAGVNYHKMQDMTSRVS
jgi:endogenous inhibitor of DNA gyrase (YacG/DUF329 family)